MTVVYVGSFPFDPEVELQNFQCKQAEYEAAYRRTADPLALYEALLHAAAARQLPPDWLVKAVGDIILRDRTDRTAERFRERMRHVERFRRVRDLRLKDHTKEDALNLAVEAFKAKGEPTARSTIADSYDRVRRDLERGCDSEFFFLVARSDPTKLPVSVTQRVDGVTVINGVSVRGSDH
jgi:hypothetical protein